MSFQRFRGQRRKRRSSLGTIVNSIKNVVNTTFAMTSTIGGLDFALAVDSPTLAVTKEVKRGCLIKAVYLEFWVTGKLADGVLNSFNWYLIKNPAGSLTRPTPGLEGASDEKRYIFWSGKGLLSSNSAGFAYSKSRWIKIPKRYQRMGSDDRLSLLFQSQTAAAGNVCIQATYKWYT